MIRPAFSRGWSARSGKQGWQDIRASSSKPKPTVHDYEMITSQLLSPPTTNSENGSLISAHSDTSPLLHSSQSAALADEASDPLVGEKPSIPGIYHGWRVGVTVCAITAGAVFIVNLAVTMWATTKFHILGGIGTIQDGNCAQTRSLSLWLHIMINVLSILLLSASNYTMQCLSSPTRDEVDKAHNQNIRLDIGVPSVRNLRLISWNRIILWWSLALSGVPLHLLYNSAVFSTLFAQDHTVYAISASLIDQNLSNWPALNPSEDTAPQSGLQHFQNASNWEKLENEDCITAYSKRIVSDRGDVLTVTNSSNVFQAIADTYGSSAYCINCNSPYAWICYDYQEDRNNQIRGMNYTAIWCDPSTMIGREQVANWTISSHVNGTEKYPVQYCLSQPIVERCKLQFSLPILAIVIGCNLMKSLCMFATLWHQRAQPLVTIGDAIESFLRRVDPTTANMCLASKKHFYSRVWKEESMRWNKEAYRWSAAPSMARWATCNVLFVLSLLCMFILAMNGGAFSFSPREMWQMGYGGVSSDTILNFSISGSAGLMVTILLANLPQGFLSFLFLTYNGLFSCMLLGQEFSSYAHKSKPLRVTNRTGHQRSTYRLQIPYRYGIPLLIISSLLHWLLSQSVFLARLDTFDANGNVDTANTFSSVGYSPIAVVTVLVLGSCLVIGAYSAGFRRYEPGLPLAGACSAAISAACHRPVDDVDAANLPVRWGVVRTEGLLGHCCFTSHKVLFPNPNRPYAGRVRQHQRQMNSNL